MQSLKTTTLYGCMITKTKTQDAPYKLNKTWPNKKLKIQMMMTTNGSSVVTWMKLKSLCPRMTVMTMSWCPMKVPPRQAKAAAEEVRKDALANLSNQHHMQSYTKVKSMLMADTLTNTMPDMTSETAAKELTKKRESPFWS
jgi:hypothetical protein